jgi:hypothetical protein
MAALFKVALNWNLPRLSLAEAITFYPVEFSGHWEWRVQFLPTIWMGITCRTLNQRSWTQERTCCVSLIHRLGKQLKDLPVRCEPCAGQCDKDRAYDYFIYASGGGCPLYKNPTSCLSTPVSFFGAGDQTQSLEHTKHAFYHWATPPVTSVSPSVSIFQLMIQNLLQIDFLTITFTERFSEVYPIHLRPQMDQPEYKRNLTEKRQTPKATKMQSVLSLHCSALQPPTWSSSVFSFLPSSILDPTPTSLLPFLSYFNPFSFLFDVNTMILHLYPNKVRYNELLEASILKP